MPTPSDMDMLALEGRFDHWLLDVQAKLATAPFMDDVMLSCHRKFMAAWDYMSVTQAHLQVKEMADAPAQEA